MQRKKWIAAVATVVLGAGAALSTVWHLQAGRAQPGATAASVAGGVQPCGGEALAEDYFPPEPQLLAIAPGGTSDAPGAADGRPEEFLPAEQAFAALQARDGATVQMSVFQTNFSHASPSQAANIALVARKLNGQVIPPGAVFSYNRAAGPYTEGGGYGWGRMFVGDRIVPTIGGGVCQGASTLYNVVLLADLPVVERHPHGLTVPYLAPGRDATVTESGGLDFRFRNNTGAPLLLWAQAKDRWLSIALYGRRQPPRVEVQTEVLARQPFQTVVVSDASLPPGTERVVASGQDGVRARAWLVVQGADGPKKRDLGTHTYRPSPRVILRGPGLPQAAGNRSAASSSAVPAPPGPAASPGSTPAASSPAVPAPPGPAAALGSTPAESSSAVPAPPGPAAGPGAGGRQSGPAPAPGARSTPSAPAGTRSSGAASSTPPHS